jgi:hypothetical protein
VYSLTVALEQASALVELPLTWAGCRFVRTTDSDNTGECDHGCREWAGMCHRSAS